MTVAELIAVLNGFDPDVRVVMTPAYAAFSEDPNPRILTGSDAQLWVEDQGTVAL